MTDTRTKSKLHTICCTNAQRH